MTVEIIGDKTTALTPLDNELINKVLPAKQCIKCIADIHTFYKQYNYRVDRENDTTVGISFDTSPNLPYIIAYNPNRWYNWGNKLLDTRILHNCAGIDRNTIITELQKTKPPLTLKYFGNIYMNSVYFTQNLEYKYKITDMWNIRFDNTNTAK